MTEIPKPRPVFIAALKREVAPLLSSTVLGEEWKMETAPGEDNIHVYSTSHAVLAFAGMGPQRAALAIDSALALGPASELVSIGWAGSCSARFKVGDVIHPTIIIDAKTGERFFITEPVTTDLAETLVTVAAPVGTVEKERLAVTYYSDAADMEAATVARMAVARELPFRAIKAISDDVDFDLPDLSRFMTPDGNIREAAYGFHIAFHPSLWKPVMIIARGSKLASEQLRVAVEAHIQQDRDRKA